MRPCYRGVMGMRRSAKSKRGMHFEQIPVEIVKLVALVDGQEKSGSGTVSRDVPAGKTEPYSIPACRLIAQRDGKAASGRPDSGDLVVRAEPRGKTRAYVLHTLHITPGVESYGFRRREEGIAEAIPIGERLGVRVWLALEGHDFELLEDFRLPARRLKASIPPNR
jgi:hypothetical protein